MARRDDLTQRPNTFAQTCLLDLTSLAVARRTIHFRELAGLLPVCLLYPKNHVTDAKQYPNAICRYWPTRHLSICWEDGGGSREAMIVVVASSETNVVCLRSLCGEGSDGSGEPEGLAVENNGGMVDSCRAEYSLILAYRVLYCTLYVGHLHRGGIHGELTRGARLNGCTACVLCGGGFGDEGESGSALGRLREGIRCVFETGTMIAGKKLVQRSAESSAEREGQVISCWPQVSIDQLVGSLGQVSLIFVFLATLCLIH
jgi:hypothetical protein